jgi:hypothetical protein
VGASLTFRPESARATALPRIPRAATLPAWAFSSKDKDPPGFTVEDATKIATQRPQHPYRNIGPLPP